MSVLRGELLAQDASGYWSDAFTSVRCGPASSSSPLLPFQMWLAQTRAFPVLSHSGVGAWWLPFPSGNVLGSQQ